MKKVALVFAALLMLLPLVASAQVIIDDDADAYSEWSFGYPTEDWDVRGGMLVQRNTETGLARALRMVSQSGELEYSFKVRYEAGGFEDQAALRAGQLHGGFGIQIGIENPPRTGAPAWGAGNSYLLWLNLDTRREVLSDSPEHFGFRGQVYESETNARMSLSPYNVDIQQALAGIGVNLRIADIDQFLGQLVPMRIRVNYDTGRIMVADPTNPSLWFWFDVEPSVLRGNYIALRTNSLALSFADFMVTRR